MNDDVKSDSTKSDEKLVREIAALARIEFLPDEVPDYAAKMRAILDHFDDLTEVDLEGITPTVQINPVKLPLQADEILAGLKKSDILGISNRRRGDFISVPRIVNPDDAGGDI